MTRQIRRHALSLAVFSLFAILAVGSADRPSSVTTKSPEEEAREQQEKEKRDAERQAEEQRRHDAVVLGMLNSGSLKEQVFQRSGRWTASLCAMSDDSSFLGYRDAGIALRVWQKKKAGWVPTEYSDQSSGAVLAPGKMKCADVSVPTGGAFYLEQHTPNGVNYVLNIRGGGRTLEAKSR